MANANYFQHITDSESLAAFCQDNAVTKYVGFDTEFVSENCFRPLLCLIQVSTEKGYAIIDTLAIDDLTVFWDWLCDGDHITIVHAAREEFLFCFRAVGKRPSKLFDIQLAAGMIGCEYPAAYGNLVNRMIGITVDKGETRTDWRKRPLTDNQMAYALEDVVHLWPVYKKLKKRLEKLGRLDWVNWEMDHWQTALEQTISRPQWRRVSGIARLKPAQLAIVKELWIWRNEEAERKDRTPKRILADDLIVELARRGTSKPSQIRAIRGFGNRVQATAIDGISAAIDRALKLPKSEYPKRVTSTKTINLGLLGQFLTTALNVLCRTEQISSSIVGTAQEVRDVAAMRLGMLELKEQPRLLTGWRAEIVGQLIDQVLDGRVAIRVDDPNSDHPLKMDYYDADSSGNDR
jgi:ribonuclease D